jgi:hypothetical protein
MPQVVDDGILVDAAIDRPGLVGLKFFAPFGRSTYWIAVVALQSASVGRGASIRRAA